MIAGPSAPGGRSGRLLVLAVSLTAAIVPQAAVAEPATPSPRATFRQALRTLAGGGRWAVLDLKVPGNTPGWLAQLGTATVRPFASIDQWIMRRPWEAIRAAMQEELADLSWTELFFGTAFLAAGSRGRSVSMDTDSPSASAEVGG